MSSRIVTFRQQFTAFLLGVAAAVAVCTVAWFQLPMSEARLAAELAERPEFIADNPELLGAARSVLKERILRSQGSARKEVIRRKWNRVLATDLLPALGSRSASMVMIEFTDYTCAPCRKIAPLVSSQSAAHGDIRVVIMLLPTGGPIAEFAARVAFAAYRQNPIKFRELHAALMSAPQPLAQDDVLTAAANAGLDLEQLTREVGYPDSRNYVRHVGELAADLGIQGVPAIVLGEQLLLGAITENTLESAISIARQRESI